jgi:hypothetical protein
MATANITIDYHARYSDGYSCKVIYDPTERTTYLATEDGGRMNVPYYVNGAEFVEFYFTGPSGISTQYAWTLRSQMDQLLSRPAKPAEPPTPTVDLQPGVLHIEPRQPGQSSFRQLQEARATHINAERKQREQARAEAQHVTVEPAKAEAARQINNEFAAVRNRHGIRNQ